VCIALDRQEMATEGGQDVPYSAVQYLQNTLGLEVCAIAKLNDLMQYLATGGGVTSAQDHQRVLAYRLRYGVDEG
jgi:orotate phosphoribosyltransferase